MVERSSPLASVYRAGRFGATESAAGVTLLQRRGVSIAHLTLWPGQCAALPQALGCELPARPSVALARADGALFWLGPQDYWLVSYNDPTLAERLRVALAEGIAALVDLSHARAVLRLQGPQARWVLAKGLAIDLHPREFPAHSVAASMIHGMDVLVHLAGAPEDNRFDLYVPRSYAIGFWHWLTDAAEEVGYEAGTDSEEPIC